MTVTDRSLEKLELEKVLASGIFDRSPSLAHLLTYVCTRFFEGTADQIKEYTIAVEALGRPSDFDQKRDSIVRVQFHRLREKLAEYYVREGADDRLRIVIAQGHYVPCFLATEPAVSEPATGALVSAVAEKDEASGITEIPVAADAGRGRSVWFWPAMGTLCICAVLLLVFVKHLASTGTAVQAAAWVAPAPVASTDTVRILVGLSQGNWSDGFGRVWQADAYYNGGSIVALPDQPISGTREPRLFQSRRQGQFRYDIPLSPGTYEVRLYFAETHYGQNNTGGEGGEGSRAFAISVNGAKMIEHLDVAGEVGPSAADVKVFRDVSPAQDGKLHLSFSPEVGVPFLNAIEISPGVPGRIQPIRIVAQPGGYTDAAGNYWQPDRYAAGGVLVARDTPVSGSPDPGLFSGERFGNLSYTIPVPEGLYTVKLYMAERSKGPGNRLFDILCNGVATERDFDALARAGGPNRAFVYTIHNLRPNHQGKLVLSLVPANNFAIINALEIIDEGTASNATH